MRSKIHLNFPQSHRIVLEIVQRSCRLIPTSLVKVSVLEILGDSQVKEVIRHFNRKTFVLLIIISNDNFQLTKILSCNQLLVISTWHSIAEPFLNGNLDTGRINVEELTIWPRWSHPKFRTIFSYIRGNEKTVVPVVMGKIYTFRDLQLLIDEHLNIDGDDKPVAKLRYNNGRVIWHVFPEVKKSNDKLSTGMINFLRLHNIELSAGMKDLLKLNEQTLLVELRQENLLMNHQYNLHFRILQKFSSLAIKPTIISHN